MLDQSATHDKLNLSVAGCTPLGDSDPPQPTGKRGKRQRAVQTIYWLVFYHDDRLPPDTKKPPNVATPYNDATNEPDALRATDDDEIIKNLDDKFVAAIVRYAKKNRDALDKHITTKLSRGTLDDVPLVDRCILLAAFAELQAAKTTPRAVIVNDAVEIAKLLGTDGSPRFINAVLQAP